MKMKFLKRNFKKVVSVLLALTLVVGILPTVSSTTTYAASSASLANLGKLGTVNFDSETKTGNWWKISVGGSRVFCMNLGYACHSGDSYAVTSTYDVSTLDSDTEKALIAHIAYYWDEISNKGTRAYQMTQALMWAVQDGMTSKSELISVINDVINSGFSTSKTATEWYEDVLMGTDATATVTVYTYQGSGSKRQKLMMFETETLEYYPVSDDVNYRQRIVIHKDDEDGNGIEGVTFKIEAKNIDEMYSYAVTDIDGNSGNETDVENFDLEAVTSSSGRIFVRFTYKLISDEYYYVDDDTLDGMTSAQKTALKETFDELGYKYASDLSYDGAMELVEADLEDQFDEISNKYVITEVSAASDDYYVDDDLADGVTVTLDSSDSWLQNDDGSWDDKLWIDAGNGTTNWKYTYNMYETNQRKKGKVKVVKADNDSYVAQGDTTLEGATYGIYSDEDCADLLYTYTTDENGEFETDYLDCGITYYLKEIEAPEGYNLDTGYTKIYLDGADYYLLYNDATEDFRVTYEDVKMNTISLMKFIYDYSTTLSPEMGAQFEIINDSAAAVVVDEVTYEVGEVVQTITTNSKGVATTSELPYGTYIVRQVSAGTYADGTSVDTIMAEEFTVEVREDSSESEPYYYYINNPIFQAYLKVIKIDGNTEQTVLKSGTTYQIYKYDEDTDTETLVTQSYSDGNSITNTSTWTTDESGIIMTYNALDAGTYHIYEVEAAQGYAKSSSYVEIEITSSSYETYTDDATMTTYYYAEAEYVNCETYGKLGLLKTGEILTGFETLSDTVFTYEETTLSNATFEIYAAEIGKSPLKIDLPTEVFDIIKDPYG